MDEYISRHEAIRAVQLSYGNYEVTRNALYEIPAADVAPVRHGRWMHEETEGGFHIWTCSRCGYGKNGNPEGVHLYCYHCGARMDGAE